MGRVTSLAVSLCHLVLLAFARDISASASFSDSNKVQSPSAAQLKNAAWLLGTANSIRALKNAQMSSQENVKKWDDFAVWGKRDPDLDGFGSSANGLASNPNKKWNEMAVWGKRVMDAGMAKGLGSKGLDTSKRWNEMAVWGKRSLPSSLDKKWSEMAVWGKRFDGSYLPKAMRDANPQAFKKWNEISLWGKRMPSLERPEVGRNEKNLEEVPSASDDAPLEAVAPLWGTSMEHALGDDDFRPLSGIPLMNGGVRETHSRVLRQKNSQTDPRWARVRQRLDNYNSKRPSWSNTGFTSWGKRSDPGAGPKEFKSA